MPGYMRGGADAAALSESFFLLIWLQELSRCVGRVVEVIERTLNSISS